MAKFLFPLIGIFKAEGFNGDCCVLFGVFFILCRIVLVLEAASGVHCTALRTSPETYKLLTHEQNGIKNMQ